MKKLTNQDFSNILNFHPDAIIYFLPRKFWVKAKNGKMAQGAKIL